ncbi:hypothetical protein [Streptosporangium sp. KLBMP 9127]|nr:hypothetical protein [Streptosporangium sp. KLBMP 9127]
MRRRVFSALVSAPFALTLVLTGCGSSDGGGSEMASVSGGTGSRAAASAQPSADSQDKALKFAQCMRENGVNMPDPDSSGKMAMTFDAPQETSPLADMLRVTDAIQTATMAGHASVDTTMLYDLRPSEELRDSADRLRAPQVRPLRPTSPPQSPPA